MQPNAQRVGFRVCVIGTVPDGVLYLSADGAISEFHTFKAAESFVYVSTILHGDLPTYRFDANWPALAIMSLVEWFVPEQYLTAAVESFRKEYELWPK